MKDSKIVMDLKNFEEIFENFEVIYENFLEKKDKLDVYPKITVPITLSEPLEDFLHYLCANLKNKGIECSRSEIVEKALFYVFSDPEKLSEFLSEINATKISR